jgi:hemerythrin
MSEFVPWRDSYSVGIQVIDEQHKHLLKLTNTLYRACSQGDGDVIEDRFKTTVQSAVDYVGVHFGTEEKLMDRYSYPDAAAHKNEHKKFVQKVLENVKDFESGKLYAANAFVRFLRDWILEHIAHVDKQFGSYIAQAQKEGKLHA